MNKKMMLLAISVVSAAFFVMPAFASATAAHITKAEPFTITANGGTSWETVGGSLIACSGGLKGIGSFENTTTGTVELSRHSCSSSGFHCTTSGQPTGTILSTKLPFHLIGTVGGSDQGGVLITPASDGFFAHFVCAGFISKTVSGNGVIGTITSPTCGGASTNAVLSLEQGFTTGIQKHTTHTGVNYHLATDGEKTALVGKATMNFNSVQTLNCT